MRTRSAARLRSIFDTNEPYKRVLAHLPILTFYSSFSIFRACALILLHFRRCFATASIHISLLCVCFSSSCAAPFAEGKFINLG